MSQILLLLDQKENRRILCEWLAAYHQVLAPTNTSTAELATLNPAFDLCILDGTALDRHWEWVQASKAREEPVFLPFLLITPRQDVNLTTRYLWQGIDELILSPVEKLELQARLEILLRSRQLSVSLKDANAKLEELNQVKSRFISIASHEFRNPLNIISNSTQMLERFQEAASKERKAKLFIFIKNATKKMLNLLDDVLVVTKGELTNQKVNPTQLDLKELCYQIAEEMQLGDLNDRIIKFICESESVNVSIDEKLLGHILTNLLSNAIKYSPQDSIVYFELQYQNGNAIFRIEDTGIGIPIKDQERLFESFHRASNAREISGTGLGLAIVKQCVDLHGGQISIESQVGVGTKFTVIIPAT
jgi:signal transduction histidine kinase